LTHTRLTLEIVSTLEGTDEDDRRATERRARWLKFADLALRNRGVSPNESDLKEVAGLGREEQESIKRRIDRSVNNFRKIKAKTTARTFRKAA
jgi:hypothetical protein